MKTQKLNQFKPNQTTPERWRRNIADGWLLWIRKLWLQAKAAEDCRTPRRYRARQAPPQFASQKSLAEFQKRPMNLAKLNQIKANKTMDEEPQVRSQNPEFRRHWLTANIQHQHLTTNPAVAGQARNTGYPGKSADIRPNPTKTFMKATGNRAKWAVDGGRFALRLSSVWLRAAFPSPPVNPKRRALFPC